MNFSRYNYFYANFLINSGRVKDAEKIINSSLKLYPRNVLLKQFKIDLQNKKLLKKDFDCKHTSDVVAEILYISANALSSQSFYSVSSFYLNLAKYLNPKFISFETLLAENFLELKTIKNLNRFITKLKKKVQPIIGIQQNRKQKFLNS